MTRIRKALLAVTAALALTFTGCTSGGGKAEKTDITIGEVTRSIFYAPQYVALTKGFFKEEGLNVQLQTTPGGDRTMTALLSNQIDIALVGSETSIYVYLQGSDDPVINFAQLTQTDGTFLVSRTKVDNFKWEMLKNSTFLGQRKGGMPQMAGEFVLKKHGINPQKDLNLIQNVEFANIPTAFASGTGQWVQLFEPQASIFEKEGRAHVVASFGVESGHLPYTVFMTKKSTMERSPVMVQKFTNAVYKAQQWVKKSSVEEIADAVAPFFDNTDRSIIVSVVKRYKEQGSFAENPIVDEKEWNNLLNVMESAGELKQRVPHRTLVNTEFAEKAMK